MHSAFCTSTDTQRQSSITSSGTISYIETLHIKTQICTRILISKGRLAVFTNYPSVTKDQALEETVLAGLFPLWFTAFTGFQLVGITIA